jgi:hypothetical protein
VWCELTWVRLAQRSRVPGLLQQIHELLEPADMTACPSHTALRIAQVAPLFERLPPQLYGGTERVVSYLTEDLVRQGHAVTLFASGDSVTAAQLIPVFIPMDCICR